MALTASYYLQRAAEFEAHASEGRLRQEYLDLAQRFRDVAGRVDVFQSDHDIVRLAERMVGKAG
jgi:hypothetical protein